MEFETPFILQVPGNLSQYKQHYQKSTTRVSFSKAINYQVSFRIKTLQNPDSRLIQSPTPNTIHIHFGSFRVFDPFPSALRRYLSTLSSSYALLFKTKKRRDEMNSLQFHPYPLRSFPQYFPLRLQLFRVKAESSAENKRARIIASRKEAIPFPIGTDKNRLSEFLQDTAGVEALLNTRALHSYHPLPDSSSSSSANSFVYRCTLYTIQFFNFEVTPVLDLRVAPTDHDCMVELLSCKFQGSEVVEKQNELFSACMRNYITWREDEGETFLDFDVNLELSLEVYTRPFSLLPLSAVEKPGNLVMQGVLDRLVPLLIQQLLQDYNSWLQQQQSQIQLSVDDVSPL
ncbi:hypothetical protein LUZ61_001657 [Rhynchospora tenuis]|uniref:DUF1997 family protein n=1 Tax=Rhynchospora tenuis TaxID=198213 RepID=A0AAD5ZHF4_9POAL|nr:hypothetical protein LUZ61_001657 [Rhynchospora tenuis]